MSKVLIAPLDWGLGHATRCIPLIQALKNEGWDITLASDGNCAKLLQASFPDLPILSLPGYDIRYSKSMLPFQILKQLPRIYVKMKEEHNWLKKEIKKYHWDLIISDNRPGLYHPDIYSIYITHQLQIQSGLGKWTNYVATLLHEKVMQAFNEVWIPDMPGELRLAGKLSDKSRLKTQATYIGCISRMQNDQERKPIYDIMLLLSGPEPQRTILENIFLNQSHNQSGKVLIIRGTRQPLDRSDIPQNVEIIDLADTQTLHQKMQESDCVICRSGYTTIMDLMKLKKKALLIPTPGQGEQEYLASYCSIKDLFPFMPQKEFDVSKAKKMMHNFAYTFPFDETSFLYHQHIIREMKNKIK
jgi:predicted glycosyltransferase